MAVAAQVMVTPPKLLGAGAAIVPEPVELSVWVYEKVVRAAGTVAVVARTPHARHDKNFEGWENWFTVNRTQKL